MVLSRSIELDKFLDELDLLLTMYADRAYDISLHGMDSV